jgi:hypothetical protein
MSTDLIGAVSGLNGMSSVASNGRSFTLAPSGSVPSVMPSAQMQAQFNDALANLSHTRVGGASDVPAAMKGMFGALDQVNGQARAVSDYAAQAEASGSQLTPGEIVHLTMRCNEFMFQCQLTSNIANRSSDGVQQLFRQQG